MKLEKINEDEKMFIEMFSIQIRISAWNVKGEDISFIDEDPCDIIVDDTRDSRNYGKENDNQDDRAHTHNKSRGKRLNPDLLKNQTFISFHP